MNASGICLGLFVLYFVLGLIVVSLKGSGPMGKRLFFALIWPLLLIGDAM